MEGREGERGQLGSTESHCRKEPLPGAGEQREEGVTSKLRRTLGSREAEFRKGATGVSGGIIQLVWEYRKQPQNLETAAN